MKSTFSSLISLFVLAFMAWASLSYQSPTKVDANLTNSDFDINNALGWVEDLSQQPRHVGSTFHDYTKTQIQNYLSDLEIENHSQSGFVSNASGNLTYAQNVVAKLPGTNEAKDALLIMAHYDSAMMHSLGAADNLTGVAVILETLRALKERNFKPENDIIILFSDAEEIGLLGAKLFVEDHPWAKNIGFTINFEARGTSGPSNLIIETNQGNKQIVKEFIHSNPSFPVANSLMYSVYQKLPNDTDSTVFRELLNVPGLFFAFIDNHHYYHTALDNFQNLSTYSLLHQAYYLNETLAHFSSINLSSLNDNEDLLYFNFPWLGMISFSMQWAFAFLAVSFIIYLGFTYYGVKMNMITPKLFFFSFLRLVSFMAISSMLIYGIWYLTKLLIPHYQDYIHGFYYNTHLYIAFCFAFVIGLGFLFYRTPTRKFSNLYASSPAFLVWFIVLFLALFYLPGLAYLSLPFSLLLVAHFLIYFNQTQKSYLKILFVLPMFMVLIPLLQNLIVGLGLHAMFLVAIFVALMFTSLLPVIGYYPFKKSFGYFAFCVAIFYWGNAYVKKGPSLKSPFFSSLNYEVDLDRNKAQWKSYNAYVTPWLSNVFSFKTSSDEILNNKADFREKLTKEADFIPFEKSNINLLRQNSFVVKPHADTHSIHLYSDNFKDVSQIKVNDQLLAKSNFDSSFLMSYYVVHQEPLSIEIISENSKTIKLDVQEKRYSVFDDNRLQLRKRPRSEIAMPFVTTDAILINYSINLNDE